MMWGCLGLLYIVCGSASILLLLQVLDRGEKIELLVDKTENLRSQVCYWMLFICRDVCSTSSSSNDLLIC